jgi:hypothetical protein
MVHWLADGLANQVPQRQVDRRQDAVRQGGQVQALPFAQRSPDALVEEWVLADEHWLDDGLHRGALDVPDIVALNAVVGRNAQETLSGFVFVAGMSVSVLVAHGSRAIPKMLERDVDDLHPTTLVAARRAVEWISARRVKQRRPSASTAERPQPHPPPIIVYGMGGVATLASSPARQPSVSL